MVILLRPAANSTPTHPRYLAECWHLGSRYAWAFGDTEAAARDACQAEIARVSAVRAAAAEREWAAFIKSRESTDGIPAWLLSNHDTKDGVDDETQTQ